MTLPTQRSPFLNSSDLDVNSLLNNREFQEMLQEYFQSSTMTMGEFLDNLPRFMMENYGQQGNEEEEVEMEMEMEQDEYDSEEIDEEAEDNFLNYLRQSGWIRAEAQNTSEVLMRSLLAGRQERDNREIPLRNILPQSPPPSPTPNLAINSSSIPFFQRYQQQRGPQIPARPINHLERVPSQLRNSTSRTFDPNGTDKSPMASPVPDLNNYQEDDLPVTSEFMRRFGHARIVQNNSNNNNNNVVDRPER